ncbi:ParA family protein [Gryllotalpicola reticulitermitis]|uniref:ParA family protein n=1 Tax=Gryllotalpicola reticulitermitis TaxID=1184153 RepID=A0ABV8QCJ3_9MICO
MRIVPVVNQKGGVGKSNVVMNLAAIMAGHSRTLVLDIDHLQQTATAWAETAEAGEKPLPFDFDAVDDPHVLTQMRQLDQYDLILVDTPGSLADSEVPRLAAVLDNADFVVMPIEPQPGSVRPLLNTINTLVAPRGLPYRVLLSRVHRDDAGQKRRDDAIAMLDDMELPRFNSTVREYTVHSDALLTGDVVTSYPASRGATNALDDFKSLALELMSLWANEKGK